MSNSTGATLSMYLKNRLTHENQHLLHLDTIVFVEAVEDYDRSTETKPIKIWDMSVQTPQYLHITGKLVSI